jgi:hypothetical protein
MPGDPVAEKASAPDVKGGMNKALQGAVPVTGARPAHARDALPYHLRRQTVEVGLEGVGREDPVGMNPGAAAALHPIAGQKGLHPPRHGGAVKVQQMPREIESEPPHRPRPGRAAGDRGAVEHQGAAARVVRGRKAGQTGARDHQGKPLEPIRRQWTTTSCNATIKMIPTRTAATTMPREKTKGVRVNRYAQEDSAPVAATKLNTTCSVVNPFARNF